MTRTLRPPRQDAHPLSWWRDLLDAVEPQSNGSILGRCPAHDDGRPSLHVTPEGTGSFVYCFAGCTHQDVLAAVEGSDPRPKNGKVPHATARGILTHPLDWAAQYTGVPRRVIEALGVTADKEHNVCFSFPNGTQKRRKAGTKDFDWVPEKAFCPPLWPVPGDTLPEVVYLTEGETDAIVLRARHLEAFALTKGAKGVLTPSQIEALGRRGVKRIVVGFDADAAGRKASEEQVAHIVAAGIEGATICPPDYDPLTGAGKDWRGWHLAGGKHLPTPVAADDLFLGPEQVDDLLDNPPDPMIDGWFHNGALTLIVGGPKDGKTSLAFGMFAACLHGHLFADIAPRQTPGPVLVSEEGYVTLGEKVRRYELTDYRLLTQAQNPGLPFAEVVAQAARLAQREGRPLLIDTLRAWGGIVNEGDASEVGAVLDTIRKAVIPRGVACIVIHQTNRAGQYRGSTEMLAQVETMIEVSRDDTDQHGDEARTCRLTSRFEGAADPIVLIREGGTYRNAGAPKIALGKASSRMVQRRRELREALVDAPRTKEWVQEHFGISKDTALADLRSIGALEQRVGPASEPKTWVLPAVDDSDDDSVDATRQPEPATTPVVDERNTHIRVSRRPSSTVGVGAKAKKKRRVLK
jgi:hypothetical protein